ncbi:MAG: aryl-sulfate sulfotransferase [Planctomycetota bacterium]
MRPLLPFACCLPLFAACSGADKVDHTPLLEPSRDGFGSEVTDEGLLLVTPLQSEQVHLVDLQGDTVHTWETTWKPGNSVYLTDRGTLLRCMRVEEEVAFSGGGIGGGIQEIDVDGTVLWEYRMSDAQRHHHHDIEPMPNGNLLLIAWEKRTKEEALAHGRDPELLRGEEFWPDSVVEIRPLGKDGAEIVWEWHAWDHLIQDFDPEAPGYGVVSEHPERIDINGDRDPELMTPEAMDAELDHLAAMGYAGGDATESEAEAETEAEEDESEDPPTAKELRRAKYRDADWMHTNGIDYNAKLDQIAISVRTFDEIWIIDHSTTTAEAAGSTGGRQGKGGDLLYRWGNPAAYGMGTIEDRVMLGQHDVQWIEDGHLGAGGLIIFNNGSNRPDESEWSSIEEWWPPQTVSGAYLRAEGTAFGPIASSWTYSAPEKTDFYSSFISGVQRLPNGNTLICSGADGLVFEVHPSGIIVWEWECDLVPPSEDGEDGGHINDNALFRVQKLPLDHPGLEALRAKGILLP